MKKKQEAEIVRGSAPALARSAMWAEAPSHLEAHLGSTHHRHIRRLSRKSRRTIEDWISSKEVGVSTKILEEIPVVTIRPTTKMRGGFLRHAVQIEWLFLVQWAGQFLGEVAVQRKRRKFAAVSMLSGTEPELLRRGLGILRRRVGARARGNTVVLEIPSLYFGALWFRGAARSGSDVIVPIRHNFLNLRVCRPYARNKVEKELLRLLKANTVHRRTREAAGLLMG